MPYLDTNTGNNNNAPNISTIKEVKKINLICFTIPPTCGTDKEFCIVCRCIRLIFLPAIIVTNDATVITPNPPICIKIRIIPCPKYDQYEAVSYTTRPVTQTADVDVNNAFPNGVTIPAFDETGHINNNAPMTITPANPSIMI